MRNTVGGDVALLDELGRCLVAFAFTGEEQPPLRGVPQVVLDPFEVLQRGPVWRAAQVRGLELSRCRCARARVLRVLTTESDLVVRGCPIRILRGEREPQASFVSDCSHCDFQVGIRYADREQRRPELLCGFVPRIGFPPRRQLVTEL